MRQSVTEYKIHKIKIAYLLLNTYFNPMRPFDLTPKLIFKDYYD